MKGDLYPCPNVGYTVLSEKNGKRYATEAAIGLVDSARRQLGLQGVFGFCSKGDTRSRRVLGKIWLEFRGGYSAGYASPGM